MFLIEQKEGKRNSHEKSSNLGSENNKTLSLPDFFLQIYIQYIGKIYIL